MYAKNQSVPPKYEFPYQEQQRYSGSLVIEEKQVVTAILPQAALSEIAECVRRIESKEMAD